MANKGKSVKIEEDIRIYIHRQIDLFLRDENQIEFDFPSHLTKQHRMYIHDYVKNKQLKSKSHGTGANRYMTICKKNLSDVMYDDAVLNITHESGVILNKMETLYSVGRASGQRPSKRMDKQLNTIDVTRAPPSIPPPSAGSADINSARKRLPITQFHEDILASMEHNQVIIISGNTGSGKTTQVPQYILEHAAQKKQPCRIVCTQPRRISAVTVAERVCYERNEKLGGTVGYQIRLEHRVKPTTNVTFCTNGVLLRCLMDNDCAKYLQNVTHIIIDEVHERDQYSDFLMVALKNKLMKNPHLKIILMSATMESDTFSKYFNECPVIEIPGRLFPIEIVFLEDILLNIETYNHRVQHVRDAITSSINFQESNELAEPATVNMDHGTVQLLNDILEVCWMENKPNNFHNFFLMVDEETIPINFKHTETQMTALMIAAAKGYTEIVQKLLDMGADPHIQEKHGYNAFDWACLLNGSGKCSDLLRQAIKNKNVAAKPPRLLTVNPNDMKSLLDAYHTSTEDDRVDHRLIFDIIMHICNQMPAGGMLVFLPGYDDIQEQYRLLTSKAPSLDCLQVFMLHSNMQIIDQQALFKPVPSGVYKIILSTNIAETSITIDDVLYVIDSGKVKQKYYDPLTSTSSLTTTWISQACATQRAGRAGRTRPGICYRLYSRTRHCAMDAYSLPEILRVPLAEICLQTAMIMKDGSIGEFLKKSLTAPSAISIKQSIKYLQKVGALDDDENLTNLGYTLAELPVDVRLGKMLLYGILFKCYEPVLMIVCIMSVNDLFVLPSFSGDTERANKMRHELADNSYSDCYTLLRAYQRWLNAYPMHKRKKLCHRLFLNPGKLSMVHDLRNKLHDHLCTIGLVKSYRPAGGVNDLNEFACNWSLVKGILLVGLYPNVSYLCKHTKTLKTRFEKKIFLHPSSVFGRKVWNEANENGNMLSLPSQWITFDEKSRAGRGSMIRCNTVVSPLTIAIFAGPFALDEAKWCG
ncbi:3'-5' RNA helicase YTHDC2-like [Anopheles maculipalpis]|uniref:3'-5' RNA helicase YTHDC2-like n=1 Tax=Anopheles maculipalpis TaxID=1496333 RepID=UPI002158CF56|nr:3'-5' RNA helicase YTHDC2-like [Anopheles maculipalpis]